MGLSCRGRFGANACGSKRTYEDTTAGAGDGRCGAAYANRSGDFANRTGGDGSAFRAGRWRRRACNTMSRKHLAALALGLMLASGKLPAQGPPDGEPPRSGAHRGPGPGPPGPMDRAVHVGPPGRWWSDPRLVQLLQLTASQQKAMDKVFDQNRAKLIDLNNALRREEAALKPLVAADDLDEGKTFLQIDRVAQARAELEKANGRMLIELRKLLVGDQWHRLQADDPANRDDRMSH